MPFDPKKDLTIVVGVDANTWRQFCLSVQTWMKHRPEMWDMPWVVFVDHTQLSQTTVERHLRESFKIKNLKVVEWPPPDVFYESQRAKMLAGHVHVPDEHVETEWILKIDADAVASRRDDWMPSEWFKGDHVCVCSRWFYTKGRQFLPRLEAWGDMWADTPRLNIQQEQDQLRVGHARFCSWLAFYRTSFAQNVAGLCSQHCGKYLLPVPSEDSTRWYAAARMQLPMRIESMKKRCWENHSRFDALQARVLEILER